VLTFIKKHRSQYLSVRVCPTRVRSLPSERCANNSVVLWAVYMKTPIRQIKWLRYKKTISKVGNNHDCSKSWQISSQDLVRSFHAHKIHAVAVPRFTSPAVQKPVPIPTDLSPSFLLPTMSGLSPVRRLRTKTSDISDFFRGSSSHHTQRQSPSSIDLLQQTLPQQVNEQSSPPKAKRSRIPFLGRSKKKSNPPTSDNHGVLETTTLPSAVKTLPSGAVVSNDG
jgi:hypothetical protein